MKIISSLDALFTTHLFIGNYICYFRSCSCGLCWTLFEWNIKWITIFLELILFGDSSLRNTRFSHSSHHFSCLYRLLSIVVKCSVGCLRCALYMSVFFQFNGFLMVNERHFSSCWNQISQKCASAHPESKLISKIIVFFSSRI